MQENVVFMTAMELNKLILKLCPSFDATIKAVIANLQEFPGIARPMINPMFVTPLRPW
jgi:hypothetical protein